MDTQQFKTYFKEVQQWKQFQSLLGVPWTQDPRTVEYLRGRGILPDNTDFEAYFFQGSVIYKDRSFELPECIVVPLRDPGSDLRGVWIRYLKEKRFYIWMLGGYQKFWLGKEFNQEKPTIVCESIFDALSLGILTGNSGNFNLAASLGVSLGGIKEFMKAGDIVAFDQDKAGQLNALKELEANPALRYLKVSGVPGKDFNEMLVQGLHPTLEIKPSISARILIKQSL